MGNKQRGINLTMATHLEVLEELRRISGEAWADAVSYGTTLYLSSDMGLWRSDESGWLFCCGSRLTQVGLVDTPAVEVARKVLWEVERCRGQSLTD
jgi:hypothetical protein